MNNSKLIGALAGIILTIVLGPFICMWGWGAIARAFNLPTFSWGEWFLIGLALRVLTGRINSKEILED